MRDTEVVFLETQRAYDETMSNRRRPAAFRRAFEEYVTKSQHLTEVMRVEFAYCTGHKWKAASFSGWNPFSDVLKVLRRSIFHGSALMLDPVEISVYPIEVLTHFFPRKSERSRKSKYGLMKSKTFDADQFDLKYVGPGVGLPYPSNPGVFVFPLKQFVTYEIGRRVDRNGLEKALFAVNTRDAVKITSRSFTVLKNYFEFYNYSLNKHNLNLL